MRNSQPHCVKTFLASFFFFFFFEGFYLGDHMVVFFPATHIYHVHS